MKTIKLTIYTLLVSVILTSCIKNKQESTTATEDVFEISEITVEDTDDSVMENTDSINQIVITDVSDANEDAESSKQVYASADAMPEFTGGDIAMMNFLKDNLSSNVDSDGRVVVRFVVDSKGNINDPTIVRSLSLACDKEALRVIRKMPQWTPGKKNGKAVSVYYTLPVLFKNNN